MRLNGLKAYSINKRTESSMNWVFYALTLSSSSLSCWDYYSKRRQLRATCECALENPNTRIEEHCTTTVFRGHSQHRKSKMHLGNLYSGFVFQNCFFRVETNVELCSLTHDPFKTLSIKQVIVVSMYSSILCKNFVRDLYLRITLYDETSLLKPHSLFSRSELISEVSKSVVCR